MVVKIFFGKGERGDGGGVGFTGVWCEKNIIWVLSFVGW